MTKKDNHHEQGAGGAYPDDIEPDSQTIQAEEEEASRSLELYGWSSPDLLKDINRSISPEKPPGQKSQRKKLVDDHTGGVPVYDPENDPENEPAEVLPRHALREVYNELKQINTGPYLDDYGPLNTDVEYWKEVDHIINHLKNNPVLKKRYPKLLNKAVFSAVAMVNNGLLGEFGEYRKHYLDAIPDEGFYLNNLSRHEASAVRSAARDKITAEFIKILNKIHFELIRKLEQHLAAPHMAKALEPLDKQCNWIYKDAKILKRFSKYIPVANWVYSLAPEYPDSKEMDKMQAMVKGYQYIPIAKRNNIKPGETVDMYPVAVVATDDRFYSDMIKRMAGRDKTKTITKRHAQKIIKSLVDANVFERRPGQRANYLIVGYYFTNMTRYYKRPIMTKKMSAAKLRKFKIF